MTLGWRWAFKLPNFFPVKLNPDQWPIGLCWRLQRLWLARSQQSRTSDCYANAKKPELAAFIGSIVGRNIYRISSSPPFGNNWNSGKLIALFICCGCCVSCNFVLLAFVNRNTALCFGNDCCVLQKFLCPAKDCCALKMIVVLQRGHWFVLLKFCKQEPTERNVKST